MRIFFVTLVLILYCALNYYIGIRSYRAFSDYFPRINAVIFWLFFSFITLSYIIAAIFRKKLPGFIDNAFNYIGAYWLAAFSYLISMLFIADVVYIIVRKMKKIPVGVKAESRLFSLISIFIILVVAVTLIYGTIHADTPKVTNYDIHVDKQCEGLKELNIVMVSDIHIGRIIGKNRIESMVNSINSLKPDIILLGGDIIDGEIQPYVDEDAVDVFRELKSTYGTYAVLGNHDYMSGNMDKIIKLYDDSGMKVLKDEVENVDNKFYIVGRDDKSSSRVNGRSRKQLSELTYNIDKNKPIILLDHQPGNADETKNAKIDLQLSGHTHGGQFFPNNLITKRMYAVDWGLLKMGSTNIIVSCGYGTWGPPVRIGTDSEIVNVHMYFK